MNTIAISDARAKLPELVEKVFSYNEEVVITVNGKAKAVMVNIEDVESWKETCGVLSTPGLKAGLRKGLQEAKQGLGTPLSELP